MHQIIAPSALVAGAICVDHLAEAMHLALDPLAVVFGPGSKRVMALSVHLIVLPHALVLLLTKGNLTAYSTRESDFALAVLNFTAFVDFPLADVHCLVDVFESAETFLRTLGSSLLTLTFFICVVLSCVLPSSYYRC